MKMRTKLWQFGLMLGLLIPSHSAMAVKTVSLTFDDGLSQHVAVDPLLIAAGMHGTFYIISSTSVAIGTPGYMTLPQILTIQSHGHEMGGHTITHPGAPNDLTTLTPAQQLHEICDGRAQLIADGLSPVVSFAYPEGAANASIETIVQSCGFTNARGAWCNNTLANGACDQPLLSPGGNPAWGSKLDPYWIQTPQAIEAHPTSQGDVPNADPVSMENYVTSANDGGWIVYQFHYVCPDADTACNQQEYSVNTSTFTAFLTWLQGQQTAGSVIVKAVGEVMGGFTSGVFPATPAILSLSPSTVIVGSSSFTLTVNGTNFVSGSTVRLNGVNKTTAFISATQLTAAIPATDIATIKVTTVTVINPDSTLSPGTLLNFANPVPAVTALSSTFTVVGSPALTLTVTGSNFVNGSVVRWNGATATANRTTTYVSSTTLTVAIPATDLTVVKIDSVTVFNAAPGGGTSATRAFTVVYPVPALTAITPNTAIVGISTVTLTLTGSNFVSSSTVRWNGAVISSTTFVNSTTLRTLIPPSALAVVGINNVSVFNPAPGGGTSADQQFVILNPVPALTSISPSFVLVGSTGTTLTIKGTNFVGASAIQLNGVSLTTTFVSSTTLTSVFSAGSLATVQTSTIAVFNPPLGGGTSTGVPFIVGNPAPILTTLSSVSAIVGGPTFVLQITGNNFVSASAVQWNGTAIPTTFVNGTTLTAQVPASDIIAVGIANVTVANPAPGGATSAGVNFSIVNPIPVLTSISPSFAVINSTGVTVTAIGSNFVSGSIIQWNGAARITNFVNGTTMTAFIPFNDLSVDGTFAVTIFSPALGGGTSNAKAFTISDTAPIAGATSNTSRVHPNPWRANLHTNQVITFDQMPADSTVKIFTSSAHSVKTLSAPAGSVTWDLKNDSGDTVASGYYIYLVTSPQGKSRGTLAIIR